MSVDKYIFSWTHHEDLRRTAGVQHPNNQDCKLAEIVNKLAKSVPEKYPATNFGQMFFNKQAKTDECSFSWKYLLYWCELQQLHRLQAGLMSELIYTAA